MKSGSILMSILLAAGCSGPKDPPLIEGPLRFLELKTSETTREGGGGFNVPVHARLYREYLLVTYNPGAADERNRAGLLALVGGTLASAGFAALVAARIFAGQLAAYFRIGSATTGLGFSLSLALVGAGQLIGISVGLAMLTGLFIAWGVATPVLTALHPAAGPAADVATTVWSHQVRFIGAGAIGIAAVWSLGRLVGPVVAGVASALAAAARRRAGEIQNEPRTERDLPIGIVGLISLCCLIPLAVLLANFLAGGRLTPIAGWLTLAAVIYVVIVGFFVAAVRLQPARRFWDVAADQPYDDAAQCAGDHHPPPAAQAENLLRHQQPR